MTERSRAPLTIPASNGNIIEIQKVAAMQSTHLRKRIYRILGVLICAQLILWLADGRNRIYRQVSFDVPFTINWEHDYMESIGFGYSYSNKSAAVLLTQFVDKIGTNGVKELANALVPFNTTVRIADSLPKDGMPDGETAILYVSTLNTPLLARTELTFWYGNVGASFWRHYHLYVLGFWFHLTGRGTGVS